MPLAVGEPSMSPRSNFVREFLWYLIAMILGAVVVSLASSEELFDPEWDGLQVLLVYVGLVLFVIASVLIVKKSFQHQLKDAHSLTRRTIRFLTSLSKRVMCAVN